MSRTLTVDVPRDYWLTMNRQVPNHAYRRRLIASLHDLTAAAAMRQGLAAIPTPCTVTWTIRYPKGVGPADPVNAVPTTKALLDALVPRYLIADDSRHVVAETFRRGTNLDCKGHQIIATFEEA